jgi:hypothetical protein
MPSVCDMPPHATRALTEGSSGGMESSELSLTGLMGSLLRFLPQVTYLARQQTRRVTEKLHQPFHANLPTINVTRLPPCELGFRAVLSHLPSRGRWCLGSLSRSRERAGVRVVEPLGLVAGEVTCMTPSPAQREGQG